MESQSQTTIMSSSTMTKTSSSSGNTATYSSSSASVISTPSFSNRKTGQTLTLLEAINTGLLDPKRGQYLDPVSGRALALSDAAGAGLVDANVVAALTQPTLGLRDPRSARSISLLQAIQMGLYDVARACLFESGRRTSSAGHD